MHCKMKLFFHKNLFYFKKVVSNNNNRKRNGYGSGAIITTQIIKVNMLKKNKTTMAKLLFFFHLPTPKKVLKINQCPLYLEMVPMKTISRWNSKRIMALKIIF